MIEDYYKILKIKPRNGLYKISIQYLRLSRRFFNSKTKIDDESFYEINRAFEVLRKPELRKYYDIVYRENKNQTLDLNNSAIEKYLLIIHNYELIGNQRAQKLIQDQNYLEESKINQSWLLLFLNYIFYFSGTAVNLTLSPLAGFIFLAISIFPLCKDNGINNPSVLGPSILIIVFGLLIIIFNFRQFIIDRMNK